MTDKNITDLSAATVTTLTDLILGRIGAETEDRKIPLSVVATLLRTTGLYGAVGQGLSIKEGTNAKAGVSTMVAGTVTVANTSVTTNSRIKLTVQSLGTVSAPKAIAVTARVAATSFTITSADATDTSVVYWEINENT